MLSYESSVSNCEIQFWIHHALLVRLHSLAVLNSPCVACKTIFFSKLFQNLHASHLTVNSIWGKVVPPLLIVKNVKKNVKCNQYTFLQVFPKSSWTNFKTIFKTLSALGDCHVTMIGGVVYKKFMIFEVFENISVSFWHFFVKSFRYQDLIYFL